MLIGYARVSTEEQNLELQLDELKKAGCEKFYTDKISGTKSEREGLREALNSLRENDTLVVWRLDRLGRNLKHLVELVEDLRDKEIGFKSITESIDTTTGAGKLIFHIFASLAEFERNLISERTKAGLASARARGRLGGRPKAMNAKKIAKAKALHADKSISIKEICQTLGVSKATFYNYIGK